MKTISKKELEAISNRRKSKEQSMCEISQQIFAREKAKDKSLLRSKSFLFAPSLDKPPLNVPHTLKKTDILISLQFYKGRREAAITLKSVEYNRIRLVITLCLFHRLSGTWLTCQRYQPVFPKWRFHPPERKPISLYSARIWALPASGTMWLCVAFLDHSTPTRFWLDFDQCFQLPDIPLIFSTGVVGGKSLRNGGSPITFS